MRRALLLVSMVVLVAACTNEGSPTVAPASSTSEQPATTDSLASGATPTTDTATEPGGMTVKLSGSAVVGGGDSDGSGTAVIRLVPERAEVCYDLAVTKIGTATQAHLHRGGVGEDGAALLSFTPPDKSGKASNCAAGDSLLLEELQSAPHRFYIDIHNAEFPMGALRGQLSEEAP